MSVRWLQLVRGRESPPPFFRPKEHVEWYAPLTTDSKPSRLTHPILKPILQPVRMPSERRLPECTPDVILFWGTLGLVHALAIAGIVLLVHWCNLYGGFAWSKADQIFWFHPLLMVLGLVFCQGESIMVYRILSFLPKFILKCIHASLHLSVITLSSYGLAAVFESHRRHNKADLYSLHSWAGLATFGFFCLQYVISFVIFLVPVIPLSVRSYVKPIHTFLGVGIFIMSVTTSQMGLTESLVRTPNYNTTQYTEKGTIGNVLGLLMMAYAFVVVFIVIHNSFKRKPLSPKTAPTN